MLGLIVSLTILGIYAIIIYLMIRAIIYVIRKGVEAGIRSSRQQEEAEMKRVRAFITEAQRAGHNSARS